MRWGSPSLAAVAGGQAVLGPAIVVGSLASAASAWLAAAAIVVATPRLRDDGGLGWADRLGVAAVAGIAAGAVAAGPTLVDEPVVRIAGVVVATGAALLAARLPHPRVLGAVLGAAGLALAVVG